MRAADPGAQLRNSAVPSPHSPLTIGPIKMPGTRKTSATGRPFSGRTMNQATAVGKIAPKMMAPTQ